MCNPIGEKKPFNAVISHMTDNSLFTEEGTWYPNLSFIVLSLCYRKYKGSVF